MLEKTGFMADTVDYENGMYDFGKVMRRILMVVALIIFIVFRKSLRFGALVSSGLKIRPGFLRQFLFGFFLAGTPLLIYYGLGLLTGAWIIHIDYDSAGVTILYIIKYALIGCLIGIIEEILFRGFVLQSFLESMSLPVAVCACSLIYSMLHFFKADVFVSTGFQPFVGFVTIAQFFKPIFFEFFKNLPAIIGLFLVGVVLSYAFIKTKSLYLSIGLHTGMVFMMKADGMFLVRVREKLGWLFGDSKLVTGVLVWFFLILILFVIKRIYSRTVPVNQGNDI
ncbi:MAG: CPBP family intramembrane metalloprotease [Candidatus Scalindua sp.]|nr:CPBP family intramembrane metalloprotease [Candidatus Scalindua sp.]MBT5307251.1 CPBP family intramembrane metalloprotease [Candidatus Scalindua sp.]MBT6230972.1 CPBP family intramembrane metalloprotease [Candidatus Scalindua sp.]MBT6561119.1 CPBP family intramembrane metalloprotease [Candidatus Scalindua sp.]MBT7210372.1 CPBP family intramembrane metalloprotease [Candidatus Scalindua sp.]